MVDSTARVSRHVLRHVLTALCDMVRRLMRPYGFDLTCSYDRMVDRRLLLLLSMAFSLRGVRCGAVRAPPRQIAQDIVALYEVAQFVSAYDTIFLLTTMAGLYRWIFKVGENAAGPGNRPRRCRPSVRPSVLTTRRAAAPRPII